MSAALLRRVSEELTGAGIPHMLTGSFAAAWYGAARATLDIDMVIDATPDQLGRFVARFPAEHFYMSLEAALEARSNESQFNLIDLDSGWKVDLIIRKARAFSRTEFERRIPFEYEGAALSVVSAEDLMIAKLEWAKMGGSRRQLEDVARLLELRAAQLDSDYLVRWVKALGLDGEWTEARRLRDHR